MQAAKAPQQQRVQLQDCHTYEVWLTVLEMAIKAASCREGGLEVEVCDRVFPVPCMLPGWFDRVATSSAAAS